MGIQTAKDLKDTLINQLVGRDGQSGFEMRRDYLGMSGIGHCQRQLYNELVFGRREPQPGGYWRCWIGLAYQEAIRKLLCTEIDPVTQPLVASFDDRFRGHPDFQTADAKILIEFKTTTYDAFRQIRVHGVYPETHQAQIQAYLQHGSWDQAILIYMARDIPNDRQLHVPAWTFNVFPNSDIGGALNAKAKKILEAFDHHTPPACLCGRHNNGRSRSESEG